MKKEDNDTKFSITKRRSPLITVVSSLFAILIIALSFIPTLSSINTSVTKEAPSYKAEAAIVGLLCNDFGLNMEGQTGWKISFKDYPLEEKDHRTFTLQESLGNATRFVSYNGEGKGDAFFVADKSTEPPSSMKTDKAKLEALRTFGNCSIVPLMVNLSNLSLNMSSGISTIASYIVAKAFDPNLICSDVTDDSSPTDGCFDLLKIIGGSGDSGEGIIGVLTSSIYYPLLVMAIAVTGIWVAYKGIVKRKLREALFGAIWVVLSVIFGLALLLNPSLIAKAPMAVSNSVATCIIGAFNGDNCFTNESTGDSIDSNDEVVNVCESDVVGASLPEKMSLTTNSITCNIWKAFILNPVSEASFGTNFDNLTTTKEPLKTILKNAGLEPNDYCINLGSSSSAKSQYGKTLSLNNGNKNKVCNLMAYQMFLQVDATSTSVTLLSGNIDKNNAAPGKIDERWYKIIDAAAADNGMWQHWSPSTTSAANKFSISGLTLITAILGSTILVVTALFALVYFLSGILLMAFAPIFLLIGVHPGRGKSIMLGWLEKVISNVLKYIASAAFLIVAIAIYGGILSNINNMALTLLFVIIITMALFMYRHELMDLFGRVSMGGEKMSSAMSDKLRSVSSGAAKRTGRFASAAVGGAVGATLASGQGIKFGNPIKGDTWKENWARTKGNLKAASSGAKDGAKRDLRRGNGFVANVTRQVERDNVANRQNLRQKSQDAKTMEMASEESVDNAQGNLTDAQARFDNLEKTHRDELIEYPRLEQDYNTQTDAESRILSDMKESATRNYNNRAEEINQDTSLKPAERNEAIAQNDAQFKDFIDFTELKEIQNNMRNINLAIRSANNNGDTDKVNELQMILDEQKNAATSIASNIDPTLASNLSSEYNNILTREKENLNIGSFDESDMERMVDVRDSLHQYSGKHEELAGEVESATRALNEAERSLLEAKARNRVYSEKVDNISVGTTVTSRTMNRVEKKSASKQEKARDRFEEHVADTTTEEVVVRQPKPVDQSNIPNTYDRYTSDTSSSDVPRSTEQNNGGIPVSPMQPPPGETRPVEPSSQAPAQPRNENNETQPKPGPSGQAPAQPRNENNETQPKPGGSIPQPPPVETRPVEPSSQAPAQESADSAKLDELNRTLKEKQRALEAARLREDELIGSHQRKKQELEDEVARLRGSGSSEEQDEAHRDLRRSEEEFEQNRRSAQRKVDELDREIKDALKKKEEAIKKAREKAEEDARQSVNETLKNIEDETSRQVQEIEQQSQDIRSKIEYLVGGSHTGDRYAQMINLLDEITNAENASNDQINDALEQVSQMNDELATHTAGLSGRLAPGATEIRDDVEDQISRLKSLQEAKSEETTRKPGGGIPRRPKGPKK